MMNFLMYDGDYAYLYDEDQYDQYKITTLLAYRAQGIYLSCACTQDNLLWELFNYITRYRFKPENSIYAFNKQDGEIINYIILTDKLLNTLLKALCYPQKIDIMKIRHSNIYCKQFVEEFNSFNCLVRLRD